jgi:peptidoglycan/LPS O-acetylase OafA/YrhL
MFVVLHHMWLTAWPGFPSNTGPWWLGWLLYGHMAVAVFIVVSGFSLALVPMRNGGRLAGGTRRFVRRRAWRILPAYWAALVLSIVVTAVLLQPQLGAGEVGKAFTVHGLLLQDVVGSATPNGALWSIAVEWQIYFVFPLILLLGRWTTLSTAVLITAAVVLAGHELATTGAPFDKINHLTPQFLVLFAMGVLAVQLGRERAASVRRPLAALALAVFVTFVAVAVSKGSEWMVGHFFWMDLLFGLGVACLLTVLYAGGGLRVRGVLASRTAIWLGLFSYSIYLVHDPIVSVLSKYAFGPLDLSPLATFGLTLVLGLPVILALCYGFHLLFEAPFLRHRDFSALRTLPVVRLIPWRRPATAVAAGPQPATGEQAAG